MKTEHPSLFILDGHSVIYRSYYAIKELTNAQGQPTNAIFGFVKLLFKLFQKYTPDYVCITFDSKGPTLRHKQFAEYKIHRKPMPEDLVEQLPRIVDIVNAFHIKMLQIPEIEADDIIASLAYQAQEHGCRCVIVSNDKDIMQIANANNCLLNIYTEELLGPEEITEKMGVRPEQITDFLALVGDSSDNIPGVPGIGPKTAVKLLQEFPTVESLLKNLKTLEKEKIQQLLSEHSDKALLSKKLVTLHKNISIGDFRLSDYSIQRPDSGTLHNFFEQMGFKSLERQLNDFINTISTPVQRELPLI